MALVIVETLSEHPLTPEIVTDADLQLLECLNARNATWRYSLLSSDRHRMICTFDAIDAESVRESYRKGGVSFNHIWSGELITPAGRQPERSEATLKVIEGTYPPLTPEDFTEATTKTLSCYAERGIEWIQSYISFDHTRVICELNAPDLESIREAQRRVHIGFDRVWSAKLLKPDA